MRDGDFALRIFLPCFFVAYILILYTFNVASFRKKYGIDPRVVAKSDPIMELGEKYRNIIFAVILLMVFSCAIHPALHTHLGVIPFLDAPMVHLAGAVTLLGSLVLVRLSQHQLKSSWRIGLDRAGVPTELITTGVYARSRNPIYLGMTITGVGLLLALPNAVSFALANLTFLLLEVRIRVEEEYLTTTHGAAYAAYHRSTPRWLLRIGSRHA
ncbi:MAG: isoprenylcysteine carboxylmethyltransferase family protein [Gemmatimonadaceae bacterium]